MSKAQELIKKYSLKPNSYYLNNLNPYKERNEELNKLCEKKEAALIKKYKDRIPNGWYGFSFGTPIPIVWFEVIDEFLEWLINQNPEVEIHQIKIKFGGCRFGIEALTDEEYSLCQELEDVLFDEKLIY
jgi:hypothetical protein